MPITSGNAPTYKAVVTAERIRATNTVLFDTPGSGRKIIPLRNVNAVTSPAMPRPRLAMTQRANARDPAIDCAA